jgi:hypothetical protein
MPNYAGTPTRESLYRFLVGYYPNIRKDGRRLSKDALYAIKYKTVRKHEKVDTGCPSPLE